MKNTQKGFIVPLLLGIIVLLIAGGGIYYYNSKKTETPTTAQHITQQNSPVEQPQGVKNTTPTPPQNATIILDAKTKVAVVQAIMNGADILASNDPVRVRSYMLTELDATLEGRSQKAQFSAMTDSQLLQVAANGLANEGKPTADLATDPTAVWKINGNVVTVTHKTYAKPNPKYPAIANLTVTYQAVYVNGAWY